MVKCHVNFPDWCLHVWRNRTNYAAFPVNLDCSQVWLFLSAFVESTCAPLRRLFYCCSLFLCLDTSGIIRLRCIFGWLCTVGDRGLGIRKPLISSHLVFLSLSFPSEVNFCLIYFVSKNLFSLPVLIEMISVFLISRISIPPRMSATGLYRESHVRHTHTATSRRFDSTGNNCPEFSSSVSRPPEDALIRRELIL